MTFRFIREPLYSLTEVIGLRRIALGLVVALASATWPTVGARAQSGAPVSRFGLERLLGQAGARAAEYFALFKDLTAEETKTVEEIRASGDVARRRRIVSDFIVYRSQLDGGSVAEYRDVVAVDGEAVAGRERRVLALFERGDRSGSVRDELKRVNREGSRFDLDRTVSGLTIGQALPLQPWARAFFDFSPVGEEMAGGRRCVVVAYEQAASNPRFGFDLSLPAELERESPRYRGRLWLDAETAHVLREVREVTARPAGSSATVVLQRTELEYEPSRFGIPLPRRIVFGTHLRFAKAEGRLTSSLDFRITFAYGPFRQFTTSSDDGAIAVAAPGPVEAAPPVADESLGPEFGPDAPLGPPASTPVPPAPVRAASAPRTAQVAPIVVPPSALPSFVRPPERPVVAVPAPPPPPEPGRRPLRLPPS